MVNVEFIGRLGADSEVKVGKSGNQFLSFRIATDEYRNGKNEASWLNVVYTGDRAIKMHQWLTKGKAVSVHGVENVSTYTDRNGQVQVSRDVMADRVDFVNVGGSGQTQSNSSTTTTTQNQTNVGQPAPNVAAPTNIALSTGTMKPQETTPAKDDDDLPF